MAKQLAIGILGGTFDPVHNGHLTIALGVATALSLDQVVFVPCSSNALKSHKPLASVQQRLAMLKLATQDLPLISVDDREIHCDRPSYTIDTIRKLMSENKNHKLFLLMSSDVFEKFPDWKDWKKIVDLIQIIVLTRPGFKVKYDASLNLLLENQQAIEIKIPDQIAITASRIRQGIKNGENLSKYLPDSVWKYICKQELYQANSDKL